MCLFILSVIILTSVPQTSFAKSEGDGGGFFSWVKSKIVPADPRTLPEYTLKSPFLEEDSFPKGAEKRDLNILKKKYDHDHSGSGGNLKKPHRPDSIVAKWAQRAISEAFSLKSDEEYEKHLGYLSTGMTKTAISEFDSFVKKSNILPNVQSGSYKVQIAVDAIPDKLCSYVDKGRYTWLFDMPLIFTLLPADAYNYSGDVKSSNWNLSVIAQVSRVKDGGMEGVIINHLAIWNRNLKWDKTKLLKPAKVPCSWGEVIAMIGG